MTLHYPSLYSIGYHELCESGPILVKASSGRRLRCGGKIDGRVTAISKAIGIPRPQPWRRAPKSSLRSQRSRRSAGNPAKRPGLLFSGSVIDHEVVAFNKTEFDQAVRRRCNNSLQPSGGRGSRFSTTFSPAMPFDSTGFVVLHEFRKCEAFRMPAMTSPSPRRIGRRPKCTKARSRGVWGTDSAAGAMRIACWRRPRWKAWRQREAMWELSAVGISSGTRSASTGGWRTRHGPPSPGSRCRSSVRRFSGHNLKVGSLAWCRQRSSTSGIRSERPTMIDRRSPLNPGKQRLRPVISTGLGLFFGCPRRPGEMLIESCARFIGYFSQTPVPLFGAAPRCGPRIQPLRGHRLDRGARANWQRPRASPCAAPNLGANVVRRSQVRLGGSRGRLKRGSKFNQVLTQRLPDAIGASACTA